MEYSKDPFANFLEKSCKFITENKEKFILGLIGVVTLIVLVAWYMISQGQVQVNAHKDFTYAMEYFNAPVISEKDDSSIDFDTKEFKTKEEKWVKVESLFRKGYEDNKSSGLAPIFLAYQSEALLNMGKNLEAISVLKKAVNLVSSEEVKSYYQVKLALMQIDSDDKNMQNDGLSILKELAVNDKCVANDRALYHLGNYFWNSKKFDEAKNYWNQLVLKYGKSAEKPSFYVSKAKPKLKLISFKS